MRAAGLSWKAKTAAGGALICDCFTKRSGAADFSVPRGCSTAVVFRGVDEDEREGNPPDEIVREERHAEARGERSLQ